MNDSPRYPCVYSHATHTIWIQGRINFNSLNSFCSSLSIAEKARNDETLTISFRDTLSAYPDGMLPIIASILRLRNSGMKINIELPQDEYIRRVFLSTNWAHYLAESMFDKSESTHTKHMVTTLFGDASEQHNAVDNLTELVISSIELPREIMAGFEWSLNELTDNVLNHSNAANGGLVQATTLSQEGLITFAIVDSGQGILASLKEAIPTLRTDIQALGEAVKAGVTRNKSVGQGNGLAGSLRITTMTGGRFCVASGTGRLICTETKTKELTVSKLSHFQGTLVTGQIKLDKKFSISKALQFYEREYRPTDFIEMRYTLDNDHFITIKMRNESTGFGTRKSGEQIRIKIINLMSAEPDLPIVLDWEGIPVISSSFADELIGKLFLRLGAMTFSTKIRNLNMEDFIVGLLDKAVAQRLQQELDSDEISI